MTKRVISSDMRLMIVRNIFGFYRLVLIIAGIMIVWPKWIFPHIFLFISLVTKIKRLKHVLSNSSSMYTACILQKDVESQDDKNYKRKSEIKLLA